MVRCYVIDDESHAIKVLADYILKTAGLELMGTSTNPLESLEIFRNQGYADITFLDIDMPQLSGLDVAGLIQLNTKIVFTTAFSHHAVEAFEKEALDYMVKPVSYTRFLKCINKLLSNNKENNEKITLKNDEYFFIQSETKGKMIKLKIPDILYIEGLKNYLRIETIDGKYITYLTLKEIEDKLPSENFIRVHKSYIVNLEKIKAITGNQIEIEKNRLVTIGPGYKEAFFLKLNNRLLKSKRSNS
jgi:DNA-binding LytR/AlgR family response regulator